MKKIDLSKLIEDKGYDFNKLADELFPGNLHPRLALNRVMKGKAVLDANQISKLSFILDVPISELFESKNWSALTKREGIHYFKNGEYEAELDMKTWVTKVYKNNSLFHTFVLASKSCTLEEYFNKLNKIVYEN